jgi:hypothetical protein
VPESNRLWQVAKTQLRAARLQRLAQLQVLPPRPFFCGVYAFGVCGNISRKLLAFSSKASLIMLPISPIAAVVGRSQQKEAMMKY